MSDLPPYLSHSMDRRMPWTGHAMFPRKSVQIHQKWDREAEGRGWPQHHFRGLRIFKLTYGPDREPVYTQMHPEDVLAYTEDPTRV